MVAQSGKDLLVKVDMTGGGQFETIAGLRATRVSFNAESVDVTSLESQGGWRELLSGAGVKSAAISGSGVFKDQGTDERARQLFFDGETPGFQVIIPDFGIVEGPFQVTSIEYAGTHNGEATYELALAYSRERKSFGKEINQHQAIAFKLADMAVKIENARMMVYRAAWLKDQGMDYAQAAAMAKLYASEVAMSKQFRCMAVMVSLRNSMWSDL